MKKVMLFRASAIGPVAVLIGSLLLACTAVAPESTPARVSEEAAPSVAPSQARHEMLNATLWQRTSGEYAALAYQAYRAAKTNLDRALAEPKWSAAVEQSGAFVEHPPAIVLDLDETVLDNTLYETRIILEYGRFTPETFSLWCEQARAAAVPGAKAFLRYAESRGVTVFYVSARPEALRSCTLATLRNLGLPIAADATTLLLKDGSAKVEQRRRIASAYRILLLVGDNLDDFVAGSHTSARARRLLAQKYSAYWGSKWIVLPNPMYGHWEAALYGFDYRLSRSQQLERKYRGLREAGSEL